MIEKQFIKENIKEFHVLEFLRQSFSRGGYSHAKLVKTPLGDKVLIYASKPGLIVGRRGQNIKRLTQELKEKFNLDNPQLEIIEIEEPYLNPEIVAEIIVSTLERYGPSSFKLIGHKMISAVMRSGALGVEIIISGKLPGSRAKRWRFYSGYLKKCGNIAIENVKRAEKIAKLKSGVVGVKVRIMPSNIRLPDKVIIKEESEQPINKEIDSKEESKETEEEQRKKEELVRKEKKEQKQTKTKQRKTKTKSKSTKTTKATKRNKSTKNKKKSNKE